MVMITISKNARPATYRVDRVAVVPNPFEGKFVSITGNRLFVESSHDENTLYAVAEDAILTRDGKIAQPETLTAGKRIRVTTANRDPNMVIRIEWLDTNRHFAAVDHTAVK